MGSFVVLDCERFFHLLLHASIQHLSLLGKALTELDGPPVKALVVYNSNPAAVAPDQNVVLRGLRRDDLFTVVLEQLRTDTADYADILLPATTFLEHTDIYFAYGHHYLPLARPALPAPGGSGEIAGGIAGPTAAHRLAVYRFRGDGSNEAA